MNRLDKYIKQVRGISYSPNDISEIPLENYLPILKANNIQENGLDTSSLIYIHESKIKKEQLIKRGDLLLAASSGSKDIVGKNVFFENDFNGSFGAFCKVVRPNQNIYPNFLGVFFKTPVYKRHIRNLIQGANINNLRNEDIDSLKIPEFSKEDQINIANILTKAGNLISQRKESISLLDEFVKSTFLEMFGDPIRNEKGWETKTIEEIGKDYKRAIKAGPFGSQLLLSELKPFGIPVYGIDNVQKNKFIEAKPKFITEEKFIELIAFKIESGDILITRTGTVGRTCLAPENINKSIIGPNLLKITLDRTKVLPIYISIAFNYCESIVESIKQLSPGATVAVFNTTNLKALKLGIPPLEYQTRFAKIVEKTESLKTQYQQSMSELEHLYGSLSQKAFRGELSIKQDGLMVAAEPEVPYSQIYSKIPEKSRGFAKQVLSGKIISMLREKDHFTHIKLQKLQYLAEHYIEEDLNWNYYRLTAGPYDNKYMHTLSARLKQNKWFEEKQFRFYPLGKVEEIDRYYEKYFGNKKEKLSKLFSLLINSTERLCEAVATIYAVWNNHIILKQEFNHERIKQDFFEWSNRKANLFSEADFEKALEWMQKHEIVPKGFGHLIKETKELR